MLKIIETGRKHKISVSFPVFSSAVKGFKLFLEPEILNSIGNKGKLLVRFCKRDYIGDVDNSNSLRWNAPKQGMSIIDLRWLVLLDGKLDAWSVFSMADNSAAKFKVWRQIGDAWLVVGESTSVALKKGVNSFRLEKAIEVKRGDYIGFFTLKGQISLRPLVSFPPFIVSQALASANRKLFFLGDVDRGLKSDVISDNEGGYCIKAYYQPKEIARFLIDVSSLKKGYYSFFSPAFSRLKEAMVEITFSFEGDAGINNLIGLRPTLNNALLSEMRNFYIAPVYAPWVVTDDFVIPPIPAGGFNLDLIFNFLCIVLLLSLFVVTFK